MSKKFDSRGITCDVFRAKNETEHFHRNIEMLFIIEGHVTVVIEENEYVLHSEEILLINSNKMHYIYVNGDALVCRINISYEMMTDLLDEEYISFWCAQIPSDTPNYRELYDIFHQIIFLKMNDDKKDAFRFMELYGRLINCLVRNYKITVAEGGAGKSITDSARIQEILTYINNNYQEPISLVSLSDSMFVSVSTVSRIFKKITGVKFPDYVNQVRMHYAVDDLLNSNKSITEIAIDNGFSSPSSFNRVFKELYRTTPSQYKKSVRNIQEKRSIKLTDEEEAQIRQYLNTHVQVQKAQKPSETINISQKKIRPFRHISTKAVTVGAFYKMVSSSVQKQISQMVKQLGLSHIRMWNLFSPQCMIAAGPDEKTLSFDMVDMVLDFLTGLHVHPFFDMTDHPECVIKNNRMLYFRKEDNMGFQNLDQWSYFLTQFMDHVMFRYGEEEVSHWIFEFGNFPVPLGFAYYENNDYWKVFESSYNIIKSRCRSCLVGGPDWLLDGSEFDVGCDVDQWEKMGIYPDYYSVFLFPYKVSPNSDLKEQDKITDQLRNMDPDFMMNQIRNITNRLKAVNAPERPLFVTETTTILSNRNAMNDHCGRGTNVLRVTNAFQEYADLICFWVATDRLSVHYAPPGILHGGSGLMSKDGIPKPSYYALYFLAKLGDDLLSSGDGYIAVRNSPNNIYILCYNYKNLIFNYKYEEENLVDVYNVDTMFENNDPVTMKFLVQDMIPGGEYVIKRHIVNREHGSVMDEWKRLGFEPVMRSNDIDYMKNICIPRIQMEHRTAENGEIFLEAELKAHEMLLLHIYK